VVGWQALARSYWFPRVSKTCAALDYDVTAYDVTICDLIAVDVTAYNVVDS
jgi:hypothetical protein